MTAALYCAGEELENLMRTDRQRTNRQRISNRRVDRILRVDQLITILMEYQVGQANRGHNRRENAEGPQLWGHDTLQGIETSISCHPGWRVGWDLKG